MKTVGSSKSEDGKNRRGEAVKVGLGRVSRGVADEDHFPRKRVLRRWRIII